MARGGLLRDALRSLASTILVGHGSTATTETIYRKHIRPLIVHGADVMDRIFRVGRLPVLSYSLGCSASAKSRARVGHTPSELVGWPDLNRRPLRPERRKAAEVSASEPYLTWIFTPQYVTAFLSKIRAPDAPLTHERRASASRHAHVTAGLAIAARSIRLARGRPPLRERRSRIFPSAAAR